MSAISIQVTYRNGKAFAAYLYLAQHPRQKVTRTERVSEGLLIDFAASGEPMGIEIVNPGVIRQEELWAVFDRLGLNRPAPVEIAPLLAT